VLEAGHKVSGFTWDPATKTGGATYGASRVQQASPDNEMKELAEHRRQLQRQYTLRFKSKDGHTDYSAQFRPKDKTAPPPTIDPVPTVPPQETTEGFPVILTEALAGKPAEEQAALLWDGPGGKSIVGLFKFLGERAKSFPQIDPEIAFLVLHETVEVGIVDRYFYGPDRRWFCDGVANYGAWRVIRDLHGADLADKIHNLPERLRAYAGLREQADLRKWPAVEHQAADDQDTPLNKARYLFAERAVALMNERAGEDVLPRLFREIGKTKPPKVSYATVEKAWRKVGGGKLDAILAAAAEPVAAAAPAGAAAGSP
jgi:hypothetical protein